MSDDAPELKAEIGHVLLLDIVGYSKLLINQQSDLLQTLKQLVQRTAAVRDAQNLLRLATGDGMALVFRHDLEAPVECALQLGAALREHPELRLRMGIHSGPIREVLDVNERANVAGAGIDLAQRVMDCGDAGHILLSKRAADDLAPYPRWHAHLHDLGEIKVKHGLSVHLFNLYTEEAGNPERPSKLAPPPEPEAVGGRRRGPLLAFAALLLISLGAAGWWLATRPAGPVAAPPQSLPAIPEKSIAVLPFENRSEEKENEFFADGVQDQILTHLAQISDLKVISRTSVMQYKTGALRNLREIGQELGVARVVEGSVQRAAQRVRVNAQLIDARTDAHLWAQTYDRDLADVFAIQSEIAKAITDQLQARLSPNEKAAIETSPTTDVFAFDLYSRAKTLILTPGVGGDLQNDLGRAIELLNAAVARDPAFHAAFCQLVYAHDQFYSGLGDHTAERLNAAEEALRRATQLRPDAAETHLARANHLYFARRDYKGAETELEQAARGLPNDSRILELRGYILRRQGKAKEGLVLLEQARTLDPRNASLLTQIAMSYLGQRHHAQAAEALDRATQILPDEAGTRRVLRTFVDYQERADVEPMCRFVEQVRMNTPELIPDVAANWFWCALSKRDDAAAEQALAALGENPSWTDQALQLDRQFGEGLLARAMHDEARARQAFTAARATQEKVVQQQKDYGPALCGLALIDAALGNKEAALAEGRRAMELVPRDKDAPTGEMLIGYFAVIAAWAGEKDLAIEQLRRAVPLFGASFITSYGVLKLTPFWDPLRGDPRFEEIVASLAPRE